MCIFRLKIYIKGDLSKKERNNAALISAKYWKISSFKGIKYFPNLKYLDCGHNNLTSLDLSGNKKLENSTVIIISLHHLTCQRIRS